MYSVNINQHGWSTDEVIYKWRSNFREEDSEAVTDSQIEILEILTIT